MADSWMSFAAGHSEGRPASMLALCRATAQPPPPTIDVGAGGLGRLSQNGAKENHMGKRLTQIATRTGDDGTTGLGDNTRVGKDHLRVHAMGEVDELNSHIGLLLCEELPPPARE